MAFGAMEIAAVTRQQDYTAIKHQEDNKGIVNQMQIGEQNLKENEHKAQEVNNADNANWNNSQPDAREKGKNEYFGDGGQKRREGKQKVGQVIVKGHSGFDIKI